MTATTDRFHGSSSLLQEWKVSCSKITGFNHEPVDEAIPLSTAATGPIILNLLEDDDVVDDKCGPSSDHWMENALLIDNGIKQIISLLRRKKASYLSVSKSDETEASLLESTLLSFVATTANQIESLRKSITITNHDYAQHCSGIVACLLLTLRQDIAEPFGLLQKQRTRLALALYQSPLQCRVLLTHEGGRDIQFIPKHDIPRMGMTFVSMYDKERFEACHTKRPKSILNTKHNVSPVTPKKFVPTPQQGLPKKHSLPYQEQSEPSSSYHHESLMQEALLLQATLTNDLDTVQQVEARMTEITTLLSQFSALVSEQQEEIEGVYESTVQSQDNVQKGQDSLVDAAERTKQSKHRMATVVFLMGLTLLLFNHFTP
jgi:hypothetical protein